MKLIGELYKEKVLSLPRKQRKKFEIPLNDGVTKIENDFFGWKLYYRKFGRKSELVIECRSEEESRYLKLFMELEAREIYIPKDDNYIRVILPEFENLKQRTDEILNEYLETLMRKVHRERLKFMVYKEVMCEPI
jgi:hypothetical protein